MSVRSILIQALNKESDISLGFWYLAAISVMSSVNHPEDVEHLYNIISEHINQLPDKNQAEKDLLIAKVVLRLREGALKSHSVIGFPKIMNSLLRLLEIVPDRIKSLLPTKSLRNQDDWSSVLDYRKKGKEIFEQTYGPSHQEVMSIMNDAYPDLAQIAIYLHYGAIYGELSVISIKETSLILLAATKIENVTRQYAGHKMGVVYNGVSVQEVESVESLVVELANYYNVPCSELGEQ